MRNNKLLVIGGIALVLFLLVMGAIGIYNKLITLSESTDTQWAQVENQYQRRADLIPNLVNTVKGVADFEQDTYLAVTAARSQWASAATREEQITAARSMDSAISRLLLVAENYPQLKANENFLALQAQLEGTENRIAVERGRYNDAVRAYNIYIKRIPSVFFANMLGYQDKEYFQVEEGKADVPEVGFDFGSK